MLTIPSELWPYLLSQSFQPVEVFEIEPVDKLFAAECVGNYDLETWSSSTNLNGWSEYPNAPGTITRDSTNQRAGTYCCAMDQNGSGLGIAIERYDLTFVPGAWYHVEVWAKSNVTKSLGYGIRIVNLTQTRQLGNGQVWAAGNTGTTYAQRGSLVAGVYQRFTFWFQAEDTADASDSYAVSVQQRVASWSAGEILYIDSVSITGGYERPTLYYSSQDVSWNADSYTGLVKKRSPIKGAMEFGIPDCTVTFANQTNVLSQYLEPVDMLTGARLTVRLLMKDSSGSLLESSVILFRGRIEPPRSITENEFPLSVVGLLDGVGVQSPSHRIAASCRWQFANSGLFDGNGDCAYQSSTTANGAGAATTALVLTRQPATTANGAGTGSSALTLTAASTFANGDSIRVGDQVTTITSGAGTTSLVLGTLCTWASGAAVTWTGNFANGDLIQIGGGDAVYVSSGGGTVNVTLAEARTWSNAASVRYATCPNRSRSECESRGMLHRFGGHPGVASTARLSRRNRQFFGLGWRPSTGEYREYGGAGLPLKTLSAPSVPGDPVPVLYGRRRIPAPMIESAQSQSPYRVALQRTSFHSLSVGEIDSVIGWFRDGVAAVDIFGPYVDKQAGIFYRKGGTGLNDFETIAEYLSDEVTQLRTQNVDYRSIAQIAYHREAYLILLQDLPSATDESDLTVDAKGVKIQKYDTAGAVSGAITWSCTPIWQMVDWADASYGVNLSPSDIDFAVSKPEADYAEVLITSSEANTVVTEAQGSASTTCKVKCAEGFVPGRRVDVAGVANTVAAVVSAQEITLGSAVTQSLNATVVQRPQRFESHLYMGSLERASQWLQPMLDACRGYVTYADGKIQFRIERDTVTDRIANGDFEAWASATDANNWTEYLGTGQATINRESSGVHGGTYCVRIDRTGSVNFAGVIQSDTGFEPGRWYRLEYWHKQDALSIGNANRLRIQNITKGVFLDADGVTWGTSRNVFEASGATTWTMYERTFKMREDFASTDSIEFAFIPYFTAGHSVWYDDFSIRGPYAGDFRETTTTPLMGWKDGSFKWSLDRKDRETNRVVVKFLNESAQFGDDEVEANDFEHQKSHPVKTFTIDIPAVADRDQAGRLAAFHLAKLRDFGPGCEFLATPAALAVQPGDVILVSHTVPGWTCKEQRVVEVEALGAPDRDEHFVRVRTEDYDETVYTDVGPVRGSLPSRSGYTITVTTNRHTGGILDLSWTTGTAVLGVRGYRVYSSSETGFDLNTVSLIGQTTASRFTYTARLDEIEEVRYYRVTAVTDYGEVSSAEFSATIYAVDYDATDGTHGENNADGNMIYDSDFQGTEFTDGTTKNGDGWLTNSAITITDVNPNSNSTPAGGYTAFVNPANAYDNNTGTSTTGTAARTGGFNQPAAVQYGFAAGTRTGRAKIQCYRSAGGNGTVSLQVSTTGSGGTFTEFLLLTATATNNVAYTPPVVAQNMANYFIRCVVNPRTTLGDNTTVATILEIDFQEESAGAIVAHIVQNRLELKGNGTLYAEGRRRFPGQQPPITGMYLTTTTPNRWEIKAQRLTASAPTNPLEIRIEDTASGTAWTVATIAAADIPVAWTAFTGLFDPGVTPVSGTLDIVIRTKDDKGIRCDQVLLARQLVITQYQVSSEDQTKGRYPDLSIGEATNWPKGKMVIGGSYRKVTVA